MNERFKIENAKVLKKGKFATGNGNNGPWASINLKVTWDYDYVDEQMQKRQGKMNAVVRLEGQNAAWARDNVTAGNPFAQPSVPDTYLNLWVRTFGDLNDIQRKDGQGTWEEVNNTLVADYVQEAKPEPQTMVQA